MVKFCQKNENETCIIQVVFIANCNRICHEFVLRHCYGAGYMGALAHRTKSPKRLLTMAESSDRFCFLHMRRCFFSSSHICQVCQKSVFNPKHPFVYIEKEVSVVMLIVIK